MTDLVLVRSFAEAARAAAAVDAGELAHDAVLLVARTGPVPEVSPRIQASPAFAPIRARFDAVADLNDILEPYHPLAPHVSTARLADRVREALAGREIGRVVAADPALVPGAAHAPDIPDVDPAPIIAEALEPLRLGPAPDAVVLGCAPGTSGAAGIHAALVADALAHGPRIVLATHPDARPASHLAAERAASEVGGTLVLLDAAIPREVALAAWSGVPIVDAGPQPVVQAAPPKRRGGIARRLDTARALARAYTFRP